MPAAENVFEVLALFAIAAMASWPALRGRWLASRRVAEPDRAVSAGTRFEPKHSAAHCEHADPAAPLSAEVSAEFSAEELYGDVAPDLENTDGGAGFGQRDVRDGNVLPTAQALLGGESVAVTANGRSGSTGNTAGHHTGMSLKAARAQSALAAVVAKPEPFKILLVDRREKFRTAMLLRLARSGHRVYPVENGREALDVFTRERTDLIMIHRESLCEAGSEFAHRVHARAPHVPILVQGGQPGAGDVGTLKHGVDITVVANAGDDCDVLVNMIDCSLAATRCIRNVEDDQQVRGKMLADLCYDLRSTLDVVSGYTDILSDEPDLGRFTEMLDRMRASMTSAAATVQMQSYVDAALDVAENVREERVDLVSLSERVRHLVARQIGAHPLRLTTSGPIEGSALFTDGEKLLAILSHVVTDAVRFTPTGEINIAVRSTIDRTDFIVSDTGPRISADGPMACAAVLPTVCDGRAEPQPGVGLTIAERLSRSIGATLTRPSGGGGAAQFTISIPSKLMTPRTEAAARMLH